MEPDRELLRQYAESGNQAAFAEVVRRHTNLVYSAALRLVAGDAHLAQDVAQNVFTTLARKAGTLAGRENLLGWLHTTTRYAASVAVRGERRRRTHEQEAGTMIQHETATTERDWPQLQVALDEAVGLLGAQDREAVLLRFFQGKSHREVGAELGVNEVLARKRVDRALEKLRVHLLRRGVTTSAALLGAAITANSVQAAPAGLAGNLTDASLAGASGVVAESIFVKLLLMSTKTKALLSLVLLAAILALFNLCWHRSQPLITAAAPPPATLPNSVALPRLPPVVAPPIANNTTIPPAANGSVTAAKLSGPIRLASEPANGATLVMANIEAYKSDPNYVPLTDANGRSQVLPRQVRDLADLSSLKIVPLLNFYNVPAADIATGGGLETAQKDGFVYSIYATTGVDADSIYLSAVVYVDASGAATGVRFEKYIGNSSGSNEAIAAAREQLEALDPVRKGSYELRRLQIHLRGAVGALLADVLWLKSDSGGTDLIYPYQPNPPLQQNQLYTVDEFLNVIRPFAQEQLANGPNRRGRP